MMSCQHYISSTETQSRTNTKKHKSKQSYRL